MQKILPEAIPNLVARILENEPHMLAPRNLSERNGYQMEILRTIADVMDTIANVDLLARVGAAYARHVPHARS